MTREKPSTVGVISDTHGLMRREALDALRGVERIIHAGDIGGPEVLEALEAIAPTTAVRGNNDLGAWAKKLPDTATLEVGSVRIHVVHDLATLKMDPARSGFAAVVSGHSHRPSAETKGGVLYFNPGSAGPRRFRLPIAVGRLRIGGDVAGEIVELAVAPTRER